MSYDFEWVQEHYRELERKLERKAGMNVNLDEREWQTVLALMSYAPGRECIPLINKISQQLVQVQRGPFPPGPKQQEAEDMLERFTKGNSGERDPNVRHE